MDDMTTTAKHPQTSDPVLEEVWRIKEAIAAEHDYDVRKIAATVIASQKQHAERLVDLSKRKAESGPRD
jgi:hypothetical protein